MMAKRILQKKIGRLSTILRHQPITKSKTLAEQHAWHLISEQSGVPKTELSVINPTVVVGPTLTKDIGTSNDFIRQIIMGKVPAAANLHFGFVDVRDVASAHITAMTHKKAAGERFIANADEMWLIELCSSFE